MASSAANHQDMQTMQTPSTQKGKRTSPEALVKDTAERKDGTQPASSLEAVALTMPFQETHGEKHLMQAMESTAETLGIPVQEVMDMASIANAERQEAHNGDSRNQSLSEDEELIEGMESAASQCLELTFARKFERYHVYFTKKKDKRDRGERTKDERLQDHEAEAVYPVPNHRGRQTQGQNMGYGHCRKEYTQHIQRRNEDRPHHQSIGAHHVRISPKKDDGEHRAVCYVVGPTRGTAKEEISPCESSYTPHGKIKK